jgi:hypothetical protein
VLEPAPKPEANNYNLAMEKLGEFQRAGDDEARLRIARELAEISGKWGKDETSQVIEAVAKLGTAGKPLARLLCQIIANGVLTPHMVSTDPVRRKALAALESVHPDLYQPVVAITIDSSGSSYSKSVATKKLAELGDASVAPILLKHVRDGVEKARGRGPGLGLFSYDREAFIGYMEALVKISPDDRTTFEAILAIANVWATALPNRGVKNSSYDNRPVAVAAVKILGTFGPRAKEAVPMLTQMKLDENESMRQAASEAFKQIDGSRRD